MPVTLPASITEANRILQVQDAIIRPSRKWSRSLGKSARGDTSTDPAPVSMIETIVP